MTGLHNHQSYISLTSDFAVQSQGVGAMEAVIFEIAPKIRVIHLMHGLPDFDIVAAARTLETVHAWPSHGYHVCVCDPGVGSARHALAIETGRGDFLIGPDNGVLLPAARLLGGIRKAVSITNPKYMRQDISPIFHGRDVFAPVAAHLSIGTALNDLGEDLNTEALVRAPYEEAVLEEGYIKAKVIQVNKFGSIHLNILHQQWDNCNFKLGQKIQIKKIDGDVINTIFGRTFSDVPVGEIVILRDDYGRVEVAINMGNISRSKKICIGDEIWVKESP